MDDDSDAKRLFKAFSFNLQRDRTQTVWSFLPYCKMTITAVVEW